MTDKLLGNVMTALDILMEGQERVGILRAALRAAGQEDRVAWEALGLALEAADGRARVARLRVVDLAAQAERELDSLRELLAKSR